MDSNTHPTLLQSLREGTDHQAWDEFFDRYWPLVYGYAKHGGCSDHTAEDIVQDVLATVFQHRGTFSYDPQRGRFRNWLGTIVRNKIAEHHRRPDQRIRPRGGDSQATVPWQNADGDSPEAAWEAAFENHLLAALLDVLQSEMTPQRFQAFELFVFCDLSASKVAEITGLTRHGVYNARRAAFTRLEELGQPYRERGELTARIKDAIESSPDAPVERALTSRLQRSFRSRQEN
jgi:RNA polymerase sigma-70 factor (ECF subfamily)